MHDEYKGQKIKRPKTSSNVADDKFSNSIVVSNDGRRYELLPGKPRGLYKDGTRLGMGSVGRVKQAKNEKGNVVAVKVSRLSRFAAIEKEYKTLAMLGRNPQLVIAGDKIYLFQDLIPGLELASYFSKQKDFLQANLEKNCIATKIKIIDAFIRGIEAIERLHQKKVVHADMHSGNMMFNEKDNTVEIVDFDKSSIGSSKWQDDYETFVRSWSTFSDFFPPYFENKKREILSSKSLDSQNMGDQLKKMLEDLKLEMPGVSFPFLVQHLSRQP